MSLNMALAPLYYFPSYIPSVHITAQAVLGSGTAVQSAVTTTAATTTTTATTATTTATVGSATSASATSAAYAAFASVAVPIAVTVLAALAAGVAIDVINFEKKLHKQNTATVPTVFTSKEKLIEALYAYDTDQTCTVYSDGSAVTARFRLEDYEFTMNEERGMYDLTIRNAGSCETVLAQIDRLQQEYIRAVRSDIYSRLINGAEGNNWSVESETVEDDGTLCIRLTV